MSKSGVKKIFPIGFSNGGYWAAALVLEEILMRVLATMANIQKAEGLEGKAPWKAGLFLATTAQKVHQFSCFMVPQTVLFH